MDKKKPLRFGRLSVLREAERRNGVKMVECRCACGAIKVYGYSNLVRGNTKSCGCLQREIAAQFNTIHGKSKTRTWSIWCKMRQRCSASSRGTDRKYYYLAGIRVCRRWRSYAAFLEDMGEAPKALSIDRMDGVLGYRKSNCRWATAKQQAVNRRSNPPVKFAGRAMLINEWATELGVTRATIRSRLRKTGSPYPLGT